MYSKLLNVSMPGIKLIEPGVQILPTGNVPNVYYGAVASGPPFVPPPKTVRKDKHTAERRNFRSRKHPEKALLVHGIHLLSRHGHHSL